MSSNEKIDPAHTDFESIESFSLDSKTQSNDSIDRLQLSDTARAGAEKMKSQFPEIIFTSGRRSIERQAQAMAQNVLLNRKWIERTYKNTPQRLALQEWVNTNPESITIDSIAEGLLSVMNSWTIEEKTGFSRHITGYAFDVRPVTGELGEKIKKAIAELPEIQWYTFREGGLDRWHAQFHTKTTQHA